MKILIFVLTMTYSTFFWGAEPRVDVSDVQSPREAAMKLADYREMYRDSGYVKSVEGKLYELDLKTNALKEVPVPHIEFVETAVTS